MSGSKMKDEGRFWGRRRGVKEEVKGKEGRREKR